MSSKSLSEKSVAGFIKKNVSLSAFLILIVFFSNTTGHSIY